MNAGGQIGSSLGEGVNFQTYFSFGDDMSEETNKENMHWDTNKPRAAQRQKMSKGTETACNSKVTVPANLFKPWFGKGLSERVNKKLASELRHLVKVVEKPLPDFKKDNRVLKVYRSKRDTSRETSRKSSSRRSSAMSRSSERHSIGLPRQIVHADTKSIEERCKKYYSDYLRVKINKRPTAQNDFKSVESSSSNAFPSMFLSKIAQEGSQFHPHLMSVNSHDSMDLKNNLAHMVNGLKPKPFTDNSLGLTLDSSSREVLAGAAYGFTQKRSIKKLDENLMAKKLNSKDPSITQKKPNRISVTSGIGPSGLNRATLKSQKKTTPKPRDHKPLRTHFLKAVAHTNSKKAGKAIPAPIDKGRVTTQRPFKDKQKTFSALNLFQNRDISDLPSTLEHQGSQIEPKAVARVQGKGFSKRSSSDVLMPTVCHSPELRNKFSTKHTLQDRLFQGKKTISTNFETVVREEVACKKCPTCGTQNVAIQANQNSTLAPSQDSPNRPTLTMIHNLSALTSYMRSRSLDT